MHCTSPDGSSHPASACVPCVPSPSSTVPFANNPLPFRTLVCKNATRTQITAAISNSFGFGGHNSVVCFAPFQE